jgi:wobble nucleotide-excising tRNase
MAATIEKLVVRNVGVLKAFDTPSSPRLAKLTMIYGRNGRGKTTLSSILRSASIGNPSSIRGRRTLGTTDDLIVTVVLSDGVNVTFKDGRWSTRTAPIEVFDAAFIAENLYAGESVELRHDRGLFSIILGRDGVRLAKQQEFFNGVAKRTTTALKEAEAALVADFPANLSREEFFAYTPSASLDDEISRTEMQIRASQQTERLSNLARFELLRIPMIDGVFRDVLARTIEDIKTTAREEMSAHFRKFKLARGADDWIKRGLEHIHEDSCPFCAKPDVNQFGMITLYEQIFGEAYQTHVESIRSLAERVESDFGSIARERMLASLASNAEAVRSLAEFVPVGELPSLTDAISQLNICSLTLKALIDTKRQNPLGHVDEVPDP